MESVCVLLVEDDLDLAALVVEALSECGFEVVHAATIEAAYNAITETLIHAAVLDINVGQELVFPVAVVLQTMGIPFVFASSAALDGQAPDLRPHAFVRKPYRLANVVDAIRAALLQDVSPAV